MVKVSWRDEDDGRHVRIDDGPEIIFGDGNLSYREIKTMGRYNRDLGLNFAVKIAAVSCLCFFMISLVVKLLQYIFNGAL